MMFVLKNFTNLSNKMMFKETLLHSVIFFNRKLCIYIIIMYYLKEIKCIHCMAQKGLKNSWNIWIPLMNNILLIHVKVNVKSPENVNVMLCYLNILNFPEHTQTEWSDRNICVAATVRAVWIQRGVLHCLLWHVIHWIILYETREDKAINTRSWKRST